MNIIFSPIQELFDSLTKTSSVGGKAHLPAVLRLCCYGDREFRSLIKTQYLGIDYYIIRQRDISIYRGALSPPLRNIPGSKQDATWQKMYR
jgi:hypothetical protein